jgi:hypothetical protein
MTITTYLFGLWLLSSGAASLLPLKLQIPVRTGLLYVAPVLLGLSILLQGVFPAAMVACAIVVMEPGPVRWVIAQLRSRVMPQAEPA